MQRARVTRVQQSCERLAVGVMSLHCGLEQGLLDVAGLLVERQALWAFVTALVAWTAVSVAAWLAWRRARLSARLRRIANSKRPAGQRTNWARSGETDQSMLRDRNML